MQKILNGSVSWSRFVQTMLSAVFTLLLVSCGGGSSGDTLLKPITIQTIEVIFEEVPVEQQQPLYATDAKVFVQNSPFRDNLLRCAQADLDTPCSLGELPLIGQNVVTPTINDIMNRVVVTHDWVGTRFRQVLESLPKAILPMFRPVTSIYIGSEVEGTTILLGTGKLSIDIDRLWITPEEKAAVFVPTSTGPGAEVPDTGLQFEPRTRWMRGNEVAYQGAFVDGRDFDHVSFINAMGFYWTMSFANNRVRPEEYATATSDQLPTDIYAANIDNWVTRKLYTDESLTFDLSFLYRLARIHYESDEVANANDAIISSGGAGAEIDAQGKPDFRSFVTREIDVASLTRLALAKMYHDVYLDVAIVDKRQGLEVLGCDDFKIGWGVRNRIGSPIVAKRAKFVVESMLGKSAEIDNFFENELGQQSYLPLGEGWCDSFDSIPYR